MNAEHQTWSIDRAVAHAPPVHEMSVQPSAPPQGQVSPLTLEGWLEFNRARWGVQPLRVRLTEDGSEIPALHAVYYLDKKGRVWNPPSNVYLPLEFEPTATTSRARLDRQWLDVGGVLADDLKRRGVNGGLALPPEIDDVRPLQRSGFGATVRYRYFLDIPYSGLSLDPPTRRQNEEMARAGFRVERVTNFADVFHCVAQFQRRQRYRFGFSQRDLELAREFVGDDALRAYVCYAPNGEPASARVLLHYPGTRAIDCLAGTGDEHLQSGAILFLLSHVLSDPGIHEASGLDFGFSVPATVPSISSIGGGRLVASYLIEAPTVAGLATHARAQWQYWRARREERRT